MNIPLKYRKIVSGVLIALIMSLVMSFTMTEVTMSFSSHFIVTWMRVFMIGSLVAIPTSLIVSPMI